MFNIGDNVYLNTSYPKEYGVIVSQHPEYKDCYGVEVHSINKNFLIVHQDFITLVDNKEESNSEYIISLAKYYIQAVPECQMLSSAELCYLDSISLFEKENYEDAGIRALKSLAYTIGRSHPDYIICQAKV